MLTRANTVSKQPYQGYDGPRLADFSNDQYAGFDQVRETASQGAPMLDQAQGYISGQLAGQNAYKGGTNPYAGQNPHLGQMIGNAQNEVSQQFMNSTQPNMLAQFQSAGAFGGSAMQQAMSGAQ